MTPHGPEYNVESALLKRYRYAARDGLANLGKAERRAYGAAVEAAVLANQRAAMQHKYTAPKANCASGTFHNTGAAIHDAVKAQLKARCATAAANVYRNRTAEQWETLYKQAMQEKRARERLAA